MTEETKEARLYVGRGSGFYMCEWDGNRDGLTYGVIRKSVYAETKTEAAALFIDTIYKTHGVGMGAIMLQEITITKPTGIIVVTGMPVEEVARKAAELKESVSPDIAVDWAESGEDKTTETAYEPCTCEQCTDARTSSKLIEEEEDEPEGHYLSISLARPGRPLLNFHAMLEDGGDEDELIGMGIHHLQSVLEFDRKKAMERGRAAAIASNFYGLNMHSTTEGLKINTIKAKP